MIFSSPTLSRRMLLALGAILCILPGCGSGSSSNSVTTSTVARALTQTFQGQQTAYAAYTLDAPIDPTRLLVVTVGAAPLVQGKDYFIDQTFPNVIHLNTPVPATATVVVQCTTLPTTTQRFNVTNTSQTTFTLSQPVNTTYLNVTSIFLISGGSGSAQQLSSRQYTLTPGPPTVIRLAQPVSSFKTLSVTYVPTTP